MNNIKVNALKKVNLDYGAYYLMIEHINWNTNFSWIPYYCESHREKIVHESRKENYQGKIVYFYSPKIYHKKALIKLIIDDWIKKIDTLSIDRDYIVINLKNYFDEKRIIDKIDNENDIVFNFIGVYESLDNLKIIQIKELLLNISVTDYPLLYELINRGVWYGSTGNFIESHTDQFKEIECNQFGILIKEKEKNFYLQDNGSLIIEKNKKFFVIVNQTINRETNIIRAYVFNGYIEYYEFFKMGTNLKREHQNIACDFSNDINEMKKFLISKGIKPTRSRFQLREKLIEYNMSQEESNHKRQFISTPLKFAKPKKENIIDYIKYSSRINNGFLSKNICATDENVVFSKSFNIYKYFDYREKLKELKNFILENKSSIRRIECIDEHNE